MKIALKISFIAFACFANSSTSFAQNNEALNVDQNGNVGIGIARSEALLTIRKNGTDPGAYSKGKVLFLSGEYTSGQNRDGGIEFRHDNLTQGIGFGFNTIYATGNNGNQPLNLLSRGSDPITLNAYEGSTGNVGIGTNIPNAKLEIKGKGPLEVDFLISGRIRSSSADGGIFIGSEGFLGGYSTDRIGLYNKGWRLFALRNGNVGVGGDANRDLNATLDVEGSLKAHNAYILDRITMNSGIIQRWGTPVGGTSDLGLYSRQPSYNIRIVANRAAVVFFTRSEGTNGSGEGENPSMVINNLGRVGIGASDPQAMLHVNGTVNYGGRSYAYFNASARSNTTYGNRDLSILTSGDIGSGYEFIAYSDARIKKDIKHSDPAADLETLNKLKVNDYRYIDAVNYGDKFKKGFIAQEVEQVFAEAVKKHADFIPDIFATPAKVAIADSTITVTMGKQHDLVTGDVVRVYNSQDKVEKTVTVTSSHSFTMNGKAADMADLFVYGKKANDFRMIDYDRLFTLNVSATQQLAKEITQLKAENDMLKSKYDRLEDRFASLEAKVNGNTETKPPVGISGNNPEVSKK